MEFIFCLAGGHISPFLVASNEKGIRVIDVRHEVKRNALGTLPFHHVNSY